MYELQSVRGPDHERIFEVAVFHAGVELGRGAGNNKKAAESQAAQAALLTLRAQILRADLNAPPPPPI